MLATVRPYRTPDAEERDARQAATAAANAAIGRAIADDRAGRLRAHRRRRTRGLLLVLGALLVGASLAWLLDVGFDLALALGIAAAIIVLAVYLVGSTASAPGDPMGGLPPGGTLG
jgi:hypothetical protein